MKAIHRGVTLVEMVIVMTLATLVLMLSTTTLVTMLRMGKQMNDDVAQDLALARLASQWREDVHAATKSAVAADCVLTMPDERTIRYTFAAPAVTREVSRADTVLHRDAFLLPARARVSFAIKQERSDRLHRLEIRDADLPDRAFAVPVRPTIVEAAIGLHEKPLAKGEVP